jgi:hypothetical protein
MRGHRPHPHAARHCPVSECVGWSHTLHRSRHGRRRPRRRRRRRRRRQRCRGGSALDVAVVVVMVVVVVTSRARRSRSTSPSGGGHRFVRVRHAVADDLLPLVRGEARGRGHKPLEGEAAVGAEDLPEVARQLRVVVLVLEGQRRVRRAREADRVDLFFVFGVSGVGRSVGRSVGWLVGWLVGRWRGCSCSC